MIVTDKLIQKLARLSALGIREEEMARTREDLEKMIHFVNRLEELDLRGVEPLVQVSGLQNVFRDDEPADPLSREQALGNASVHDGSFFKAPRVFNKKSE